MNRPTPNLAAFSRSRARAAGLRRGFTLVEVMVAIAIALALIVGISEIFAMAQKTTGGGTALLKNNAAERSMQSQFRQDFQGINLNASTTPGLVITSSAAAAFRNKQDMTESRDPGLPPDPRNLNNPGSGDPTTIDTTISYAPNGIYSTNGRIHRVDRLCMFVTNTFKRQTANAPNMTSQTSTQEGFVWYGHLAVLNDAGISNWDPSNPQMTGANPVSPVDAFSRFMNPGAPSLPGGLPKNDNHEFAAQWVLGRQAIALTGVDTGESMYRPIPAGSTDPTAWFVPLSLLDNTLRSTPGSSVGAQPSTSLFSSRYDICLANSQQCRLKYTSMASTEIPWYQQISGLQFVEGTNTIVRDQRYLANPFPTKPAAANYTAVKDQFLSSAAALTAPIFVRGCTQFIVEYAGNYVTQDQDSSPGNNNYGKVLAPGADPSGKLDFIPILDANGNWTRQIRWYGFPRDTMTCDPKSADLNKRIAAPGQDGQIDLDTTSAAITHDVVPLSVYLSAAGFRRAVITATAPFERNAAAFSSITLPVITSSSFPFQNATHTDQTSPIISAPYVCAWDSTMKTDKMPKMIRITVAIDEPNGRLNSEQTFEYIFELPN